MSKTKYYNTLSFTSVLSVPSVVDKEYNDHGNTEAHGKRKNMRKNKALNTLSFTSVLSVPSVVDKEYNDHRNTEKHGKEEI